MVYPVSCTAVCSYVKSWGGLFKFLGVRAPDHPSGCALAKGSSVQWEGEKAWWWGREDPGTSVDVI